MVAKFNKNHDLGMELLFYVMFYCVILLYSSTCHERTPLGPGKCPYMTGGRSSEGRAGSKYTSDDYHHLSDTHTEYMHCHKL